MFVHKNIANMYSTRHTQEQCNIIYMMYKTKQYYLCTVHEIFKRSMQQCYIDVNRSHSENYIIYAMYKTRLYYQCNVQCTRQNYIIYAMYKKYSVNGIKVLMYLFCLYGRQSCSQQMKTFWKLCLRMMTLMKETC